MKSNQMKKIEVHFSNLARGGKVRVLLGNASGVQLGERVLLVEDAEEMCLEALTSEIDGGYVYFDLEWDRIKRATGSHAATPYLHICEVIHNYRRCR